ncbi:MAG: hypothetical protein IT207_00855 [Fimbriimonadaceae bacterium]|nr:hypothetical protein [Fimbriimonadaceae bacterium]
MAFSPSSSWSLLNSNGTTEANLAGFARWGKGYADADVDMGPQSFYLALSATDRLESTLTAFDLGGASVKVATYQCLCRVRGKVRFALVKSDDAAVVFDEVVLDSQNAYTDLTLVTLRGQVDGDMGSAFFKVLVENLSTLPARWQVTAQQAWGGKEGEDASTGYPLELGLANQTFVPTADGAPSRNRYQWAVNALGVMAQSRFRLPAKPQRYGWEQRALINTESGDLRDGDVYYDTDQKAVLMVMNNQQMFCVLQPERVNSRIISLNWAVGDEKNVVFLADDDGSGTLTLPADTNEVPDGTVVRCYCEPGTTYTVGVKFGPGGTLHELDPGKMGEYAFMGGKWRSVVHNAAHVSQP